MNVGKTCRGCAGSGISVKASPREVQLATTTIYMTKRGAETGREQRAHARVDAWEGIGGVHKGRLAMSGPLGHVIEHVKGRLADGYELDPGSAMPDEAMRCEWCGGYGVAGAVLTAHSMAEAIEIGGNG